MNPEAIELQQMLDCTCGAQVVDHKKYPFAVASKTGQSKYLILDEKTEILVQEWYLFKTSGEEMLNNGTGVEIPVKDVIQKIQALLIKSVNP